VAVTSRRRNFRLLYVCTGNTSRSPFLESRTRALAEAAGDEVARRVLVTSAGTHARSGSPLDPEIARVMAERGLPPPQRWAQPLVESECRRSSLILTATTVHRDLIRARFAGLEVPVLTVIEYAEPARPTNAHPPHDQPDQPDQRGQPDQPDQPDQPGSLDIADPFGRGIEVARASADRMSELAAAVWTRVVAQLSES